jgi:hypothetical protein
MTELIFLDCNKGNKKCHFAEIRRSAEIMLLKKLCKLIKDNIAVRLDRICYLLERMASSEEQTDAVYKKESDHEP